MTYKVDHEASAKYGYRNKMSGGIGTGSTMSALAAFIWLATTPAFASDPKGINMTQPLVVEGTALKDIDTHDLADWKLATEGPKTGERIDLDPNCDHCKPLTLGALLARTLKSFKRDEENKYPGAMRESLAAFAAKIKDDPAANLTTKQIVLLDERIEAIIPNGDLIIVLKKMIDPNYQPKLPE